MQFIAACGINRGGKDSPLSKKGQAISSKKWKVEKEREEEKGKKAKTGGKGWRGIKRPGEKERESGHMLRPLDEAG